MSCMGCTPCSVDVAVDFQLHHQQHYHHHIKVKATNFTCSFLAFSFLVRMIIREQVSFSHSLSCFNLLCVRVIRFTQEGSFLLT